MTTKTPTIQGTRAKIKRAAAAAGLHLELSHSLKGWRTGVKVDAGYSQDARRAGLQHIHDTEWTLSDWLRSVLTHDELVTVPVFVTVCNSEIQVDYFAEDQMRVLPDWASYIELGAISLNWAAQELGLRDCSGYSYDRGTRAFSEYEIEKLAPSAAHRLALATLAHYVPGVFSAWVVDRVATFDETGRALFLSMLPDWSGTLSELLETIEVLVPQETPAPVQEELDPEEDGPVDPALREFVPFACQSPALLDYFARLVHEPKRAYAKSVWVALANHQTLPTVAAPWADDVVRKVRRYAAL